MKKKLKSSCPSDVTACCASFEYEETQLQFACTHSIYTKEGQSSICYVTSEERAKFMVAALDHFKASGKMEEYLRHNAASVAVGRERQSAEENDSTPT